MLITGLKMLGLCLVVVFVLLFLVFFIEWLFEVVDNIYFKIWSYNRKYEKEKRK